MCANREETSWIIQMTTLGTLRTKHWQPYEPAGSFSVMRWPTNKHKQGFPTLEPDGVVDKVQYIRDSVVLAHLHLLTLCERQQKQQKNGDKSAVLHGRVPREKENNRINLFSVWRLQNQTKML